MIKGIVLTVSKLELSAKILASCGTILLIASLLFAGVLIIKSNAPTEIMKPIEYVERAIDDSPYVFHKSDKKVTTSVEVGTKIIKTSAQTN